MKNSLNLIAKRKFFKEYRFPKSTRDKIVVEASDSGCGFKTKYDNEWISVISEKEFHEKIFAVCLGTMTIG